MVQQESFQFSNTGYSLFKLPQDVLNWANDNAKIGDPSNLFCNNLAGHLKDEYRLNDVPEFVSDYLFNCAAVYERDFNFLGTVPELGSWLVTQRDTNGFIPLVLENMWVNVQHKHEFNPIHNHSGLFSFVMWLKIPYELADEDARFPGVKDHDKRASRFEFVFQDSLGRTRSQPVDVDKSMEGVMCLFPAAMYHTVYPFYTSDEPRITMAGNIGLDFAR
jgi:hypothetical protein